VMSNNMQHLYTIRASPERQRHPYLREGGKK
jgi:hypothetical protein